MAVAIRDVCAMAAMAHRVWYFIAPAGADGLKDVALASSPSIPIRRLPIDKRQQSSELQRQSRRHRRGPKTETPAFLRLSIGQRFEDFQRGAAEVIDTGQIDD